MAASGTMSLSPQYLKRLTIVPVFSLPMCVTKLAASMHLAFAYVLLRHDVPQMDSLINMSISRRSSATDPASLGDISNLRRV